MYWYVKGKIVFLIGVNVSTPTAATTSGLGGPCPPGFYCPTQTEDPMSCPNGTYRDLPQGEKKDDCWPCKLGHYCGSENLTDATGPCAKGFYCYRGNNVPTPLGKFPFLEIEVVIIFYVINEFLFP